MSGLLRHALQTSTPEERTQALVELARELFQAHGRGPIVLRDENANAVGYLTTTEGVGVLLPSDPAWIAEMRRRAENPGRTYSVEEFLDIINRAAQTTT